MCVHLSNIINWRDNDFGGLAGYQRWLIAQVNGSNPSASFRNKLAEWTSCPSDPSSTYGLCTDEWAQQAISYSCNYAYVDENGNRLTNGFVLGEAYQSVRDKAALCTMHASSVYRFSPRLLLTFSLVCMFSASFFL